MPIPPRTNIKTYNPEIERLLYQVKVIDEEAQGLYAGLSQAQLDWRPEPNAWSMGECLDHLNVSATKMLDAIEKAITAARASGKLSEGPYSYGFLGRYFLKTMLPPVKRRFSAPATFQPKKSVPATTLLPEWSQGRERMKRAMESANGIDLQSVKVPSPAMSLLKLNLGVYLWIMTAHEKRHIWQARNVRNAPGFPAA